jgi:hypothetical protein
MPEKFPAKKAQQTHNLTTSYLGSEVNRGFEFSVASESVIQHLLGAVTSSSRSLSLSPDTAYKKARGPGWGGQPTSS